MNYFIGVSNCLIGLTAIIFLIFYKRGSEKQMTRLYRRNQRFLFPLMKRLHDKTGITANWLTNIGWFFCGIALIMLISYGTTVRNMILILICGLVVIITDALDGVMAKVVISSTLGGFNDTVRDKVGMAIFSLPIFFFNWYISIGLAVMYVLFTFSICGALYSRFYLKWPWEKVAEVFRSNIFGKVKANVQALALIILYLLTMFPELPFLHWSNALTLLGAGLILELQSMYKKLGEWSVKPSDRLAA